MMMKETKRPKQVVFYYWSLSYAEWALQHRAYHCKLKKEKRGHSKEGIEQNEICSQL